MLMPTLMNCGSASNGILPYISNSSFEGMNRIGTVEDVVCMIEEALWGCTKMWGNGRMKEGRSPRFLLVREEFQSFDELTNGVHHMHELCRVDERPGPRL